LRGPNTGEDLKEVLITGILGQFIFKISVRLQYILSKFDVDRHSVSNFIKITTFFACTSQLCQVYEKWRVNFRLETTASYSLKTAISWAR